jgi:serine/threonine protein kinase
LQGVASWKSRISLYSMKVGRYELVRKIATGGMAELFLAKAVGPGGFEKTLVLKRILPHLAEDPSFVEMFLSEAKLVSRLSHSHIVQILDMGRAQGVYYLAMEYIDGPSLRALARAAHGQGVLLPPELCAWIISEACEGLAFAHDFCDPATRQPWGLIHRDVSLDNILVSSQGNVKVVDFGIAKAAGQVHRTQTGVIKGKLSYMSPEQLRDKPLDRRVDVYALGIVFYELLTGRKPFDATTEASMAKAILFEPLIPALRRRPDLPKAVQWILDRALARDRDQRYPDCRAFQADLEAFIRATRQPVGTSQLARFVERVMGPTPAVAAPAPAPQPAARVGHAATRFNKAPVAARRVKTAVLEEELTEQSRPTVRMASPWAE